MTGAHSFIDSYRVSAESSLTESELSAVNNFRHQLQSCKSSTEFDAIVSRLNNLFEPQTPESSDLIIYQEISLRDLQIEFEIKLENQFHRLSLIFDNCELDRVNLQNISPVAFKNNCKLQNVIMNSSSNLHVEDSYVRNFICNQPFGITANADFINCSIDHFHARECRLQSFYFENVKLPDLDLSQAQLKDLTFIDVEFEFAPSFMGAKLEKSVTFIRPKFLDFRLHAQPFYRDLRKHCSENNDDETASLLGSLELKIRHFNTTFKANPLEYSIGLIYKAINEFGTEVYKPLMALIYILPFSFAVFVLVQLFMVPDFLFDIGNYLVKAMKYTFLASIGPARVLTKFENSLPTDFFIEFVYWIVALLNTILWFFLILGIRKRFKISN